MCKFCGRSDITYPEHESLAASLEAEQENAKRGLMCAVPLSEYDPGAGYDFLYGSGQNIHVNLLEQAKLNNNYGLFRVNDAETAPTLEKNQRYTVRKGDVIQIRGYDLAGMTIVYDGTGWLVMDVLTTKERAKLVWTEIVNVYLEEENQDKTQLHRINTVIYSHSHIDHYGGIGGLTDFFSDGCVILAPDGFTKHAVSENIYVGTDMKRRAVYQYGSSLTLGAEGRVDCGLGKEVSRGTNTLILPTQEIGFDDYLSGKKYCAYNAAMRETLTELTEEDSGDLILQMQYTPGTEAPAEMNVYLPAQKILFIAENCAGTLHNTLTPRGAEVRDPLAWAEFLDETLVTFSDLETVCSAHNWPHFGHEDSIKFLEIQRDMYRYINNATLHLVNLGYTIDEVGRMISGEDGSVPLPEAFAGEWCCHGFYGTYNHDAKAVYQRYIGWYDGNPAHLNRHKPQDRAAKYIAAFGADAIIRTARNANEYQDYEWAAELLDYILNADDSWVSGPLLEQAKQSYSEALTQMGYRSESPSWRNMYLAGAKEVTKYEPHCKMTESGPEYLQFDDDTINAMTLEMILKYMGIMLDSRAVEKDGYRRQFTIHLTDGNKYADGGEYAAVYVYRGILGYRMTPHPPSDKDFLKDIPSGQTMIEGGKLNFFHAFVSHDKEQLEQLKVEGDKDAVDKLIEYLTQFPLNFPIMTPRRAY